MVLVASESTITYRSVLVTGFAFGWETGLCKDGVPYIETPLYMQDSNMMAIADI